MKINPLGYLSIFMIGGLFYFLSPQPTGSEMWVFTPWTQGLPQSLFESDQASQIGLGFSVPWGAGAIDPEKGLVRWYQTRDFVSISDKWLVNYNYSDGQKPLVSLATQEIYPNLPGESPLVRDGWVFSLGRDLTSLRFSRDSLPLEFSTSRHWASVLTFVETNPDFVVAGLADGRIWVVGSAPETEVVLEPTGEWYTGGQIGDRVPTGAAVFSTYSFVIYGAIRQRGVLWNLQTGEEILVLDIPGEGIGATSRIPWFSPYADFYTVYLQRRDSGVVQTFAVSQGESRAQLVPWGAGAGFGYLQNSRLAYMVDQEPLGMRINFFRPLEENKFILHTQPFEGRVFSDASALYWIGNQRIARFDLGWIHD